ncbi:PilN domain-containing protein [Caldimonas brevitalea]|uniref:Fimbrial assembly protein n=1 Tax=Caldimonas brevitalea TaxID=413882 RepID=A0A0G3BJT0_9BURK|nr:PilN domain-containing protein [Caldimonas brevitalea]AKJ27646.1 fimbrial assembly protein [Caldimonas brevitalea]
MILINLLPHREERRRRRKQAFFAALGVSACAGLLVVAGWYLVLQSLMDQQRERNGELTREIAVLDNQIKDIAELRAEIDSLKARQKAVEDLQTDRNMPVHLLNELVRQTPEGVYLTSIRQDGDNVTLTGVAQTNERVSELLRNTANSSGWLERPELLEIKANTPSRDKLDPKRLFDFSMRVALKRPQAPDAKDGAPVPAGAASAPRKSS